MRMGTFLVVLVALAAPPLASAKDYTRVRVQVLDAEKGTPVPRAAVTLKFIRGKKMFVKKVRAEWDVKTDSHGSVELPEIPSGKVRVQVFAKGYRTFGDDFDVSGDEQTITVKLVRPGAQFSSHETPEERQKKEKDAEGSKKPQ